MCLEIESEVETFTKFSLEFLGFFGALDIFSDFFFLSIFGNFSKIAQNRSIGWIRSTKFVELCFVQSA